MGLTSSLYESGVPFGPRRSPGVSPAGNLGDNARGAYFYSALYQRHGI